MKERNFYDPISGGNSSLPWSAADALSNGYARWMDRDGCEVCRTNGHAHISRARYVRDNSCTFCLMTEAHAFWPQWTQGDPSRPSPWSTHPDTSRALGLDWYYGSPHHDILCPNGPHLRKTSISTGRCVDCEKDAVYFKAMSRGPRAIARAAGERYYTPADVCSACGKLAPRHVVTNGCTGCHKVSSVSVSADGDGRRTPSQIFAEENPDFIIQREIARDLGFTLYRTGEPCRRGHLGWRYVSTGGCLSCLRP